MRAGLSAALVNLLTVRLRPSRNPEQSVGPVALHDVPPPDPATLEPDLPRFGRDESVEQCLEILREVSAEQKTRARQLDLKAGTLAGFAATVLTLNAALGGRLLTSRDRATLSA